MEVTEKKPVTRKPKKTAFGDVKDLKTHDGSAREIDPSLCYFKVRDYAVASKDLHFRESLKIMSPRKFMKLYSPFTRGRSLAILKTDRDYREIFEEFIDGSVQGLMKLQILVSKLTNKDLAKEFGLSFKADRDLLDLIRKEVEFLTISGSNKNQVYSDGYIQMIDLKGKEIFTEDLK